jgi:hypothetical protein
MGVALTHYSQERGQSTLDQQLSSIKQSHKMQAIPVANNHRYLTQAFWVHFFTKLDVSMQYCTFGLDKESQDLCTIITPFGKYKYLRLPMRLKCSPDIAQAIMENVLSDIKDASIYIDDVGAFSSDWDYHINLLATILW